MSGFLSFAWVPSLLYLLCASAPSQSAGTEKEGGGRGRGRGAGALKGREGWRRDEERAGDAGHPPLA